METIRTLKRLREVIRLANATYCEVRIPGDVIDFRIAKRRALELADDLEFQGSTEFTGRSAPQYIESTGELFLRFS